MSAGAGNWCLIESDPGVFSELIREFGCKGLQVEELYGLDPENFLDIQPVRGLIFLFKWVAGHEPSGAVVKDSRSTEIFFAQQVIQNACATQAIVNILMNLPKSEDIELGPVLEEFHSFTSGFDPASKGLCLSNSEPIKKVHNSFSRQQIFDLDMPVPEKEDVFHFIAYVPIQGRVYELDGLQEGPIDLGKVEDSSDWLDVVRPVIEDRIKKYSEGEIHFNLMAVIPDKKMKYAKQIEELKKSGMDADATKNEILQLQTMIAQEELKLNKHKAENIRRKHNYMPFIMELMKILAKEKVLVPLVKEAKAKAQQKAETKAKQKAAT